MNITKSFDSIRFDSVPFLLHIIWRTKLTKLAKLCFLLSRHFGWCRSNLCIYYFRYPNLSMSTLQVHFMRTKIYSKLHWFMYPIKGEMMLSSREKKRKRKKTLTIEWQCRNFPRFIEHYRAISELWKYAKAGIPFCPLSISIVMGFLLLLFRSIPISCDFLCLKSPSAGEIIGLQIVSILRKQTIWHFRQKKSGDCSFQAIKIQSNEGWPTL